MEEDIFKLPRINIKAISRVLSEKLKGIDVDIPNLIEEMINEELNDKVDIWHNSDDLEMPLHEYLGMTREEYKEWVKNPKKYPVRESELKINSFVTFDEKSCDKTAYEKYYKELFPLGKLFVYLGEVLQAPGHCILADLDTGQIIGLYHTTNFRMANDDEC